jgi:hypothetical protein
MTREDKDRTLLEELKVAHNNIITVMENHIISIAGCDRRTANMIANEVLDLDRDADRLLETPSESPRKVNVFIEEHLCKRVEIEVPNEMNKLDAMKYAERKAKQMYEDEEIVLTADDFNGICLMMVQDEDGNETGWFEF